MRRLGLSLAMGAAFMFAASAQTGGGFGGHAAGGFGASGGGRAGAAQGAPGSARGSQHFGPGVVPPVVTSPSAGVYVPYTGVTPAIGNVNFPAGRAPGTYSPFSIVSPSFAQRLQNNVSGFGDVNGSGYFGRRHRGNTIIVPYGYTAYAPYGGYMPYGGYGYGDYGGQPEDYQEPPAAPPQVIIVMPGAEAGVAGPPQAQGPVTYVVPPNGGASQSGSSAEAPAPQSFYLIALKNHSIYTANIYWVEGDTLHYVTTYGVHNQVTLDQVDLDFTAQLNRERGLDFNVQRRSR